MDESSRRRVPDQADGPPALAARYGIRIFPLTRDGLPYPGSHGFYDASCDPAQIAAWETEHPGTRWGMATGAASGLVAIDIDMRELEGGRVGWGLDSLEAEGISTLALVTPTFHTRRGGYQQLCRYPGHFVKSGNLRIAGRPVPFVDIKGDRGYTALPPGPNRYWDAHLGADTVPAPLPSWAIMPAGPQHARIELKPPAEGGYLSPYCEAILRRACREIEATKAGKHDAIVRTVYNTAGFCGPNGMPEALALYELTQAALTLDGGRRSQASVIETVGSAFSAGKAAPKPRKDMVR
jgi:hypothetical protein